MSVFLPGRSPVADGAVVVLQAVKAAAKKLAKAAAKKAAAAKAKALAARKAAYAKWVKAYSKVMNRKKKAAKAAAAKRHRKMG